MKLRRYILLAILYAVYKNYLKTRNEQQKIRQGIQEKLLKDIKAIGVAEGIVLERIRAGKYSSIDAMMNDLKFERIIYVSE